MVETVKILFWLYRGKLNSKGKAPIYLRVTLSKEKFQVSTGHFIEPSKWDVQRNKVKGNSPEVQLINNQLDGLRSKVLKTYDQLSAGSERVSLDQLRNGLFNQEKKFLSILDLFNDHNHKIKQLIGKEYSDETLLLYKRTQQDITDFLQHHYQKKDILLKELDHYFIQEFDFYLRSVKGNQTNTIYKNIQRLNKIVRIAIANGYIDKSPFLNYKLKKERKDIVYLTEEELFRLENKELSIKRLEMIRDIFVFCCYTGLAYHEVKNISTDSIVIGYDNEKWLEIYRQKTKRKYRVPLLQKPLDLIQKYSKGESKLLPVPSNVKLNAYLKELADLCSIKKNLTSHIARKTFATTITLLNNVPLETVSYLLGHSNTKITQESYSKLVDKKISQDITMLKSKLN